eukprot:CAMPEP_0202895792 /NCGR_PEP_ID=MMETSP1392-20130828/4925_1 /ASSEMBLY_ACC=CAM_ASM_000868 /TAXON_ID=225041 /ORGANISM="Chlamydomonas chlamydogama, Strain SAG 11-48b" /LENGTH=191 /DNA_ID=CAMNT_0049580925 /DNA_START=49 /DNA_END=620 /DNA_ORIENTATION=+
MGCGASSQASRASNQPPFTQPPEPVKPVQAFSPAPAPALEAAAKAPGIVDTVEAFKFELLEVLIKKLTGAIDESAVQIKAYQSEEPYPTSVLDILRFMWTLANGKACALQPTSHALEFTCACILACLVQLSTSYPKPSSSPSILERHPSQPYLLHDCRMCLALFKMASFAPIDTLARALNMEASSVLFAKP